MIDHQTGAVGHDIFNNPGRQNAVSPEIWDALDVIPAHFESDPEIRVVVLLGTDGKAFVLAMM